MTTLRRGRRAASTTAAAPQVTFGDSRSNRPTVLQDGDYELHLVAARTVVSKKGSLSILLDVTDDDGKRVKIQPLLVHSPGGDSDLTWENKSVLEELADIQEGEEVGPDELLNRLQDKKVGLSLVSAADHFSGKALNQITDGWSLDNGE